MYEVYTEKSYQNNLSKLCDKLPAFCTALFESKNYRVVTALNYAREYLLFFQYLQNIDKAFKEVQIHNFTPQLLQQVTQQHILGYLSFYQPSIIYQDGILNGMDKKSCRKLSALRTLYDYLSTEYHIEADHVFTMSRKIIKEKKRNTIEFTDEDLSVFFSAILYGDGLEKGILRHHDKYVLRDMSIFMLLLDTGMLVSELVNLELDDIDVKKRLVRVIRYHKICYLPYSTATNRFLQEYWMIRIKQVKIEEQGLFLSNQKKRLSIRQIQRSMKKYCGFICDDEKTTVSPGIFRKIMLCHMEILQFQPQIRDYFLEYMKEPPMVELKKIQEASEKLADYHKKLEIAGYY